MPAPHTNIVLADFQNQVLTGLMLGDGHLDLNSKNAFLSVGRSIKDIEYLKYEANIFFNLLSPMFKSNLIKTTSVLDKRYNRINLGCYFRTARNECLTKLHEKWYCDKIKIIPLDLELSNISIAHWIADDGHISYNKLPYRFILDIATHSFNQNEVERLSNLLSIKYGEKFNVSYKIIRDKRTFIIKAYDTACRSLFTDIDPYFKMARKRLWDNPESRFYSNPPNKQISSKDLFEWRKDKLKLLVAENNQIRLSDLKRYLLYNGKVSFRLLEPVLKHFSFSKSYNLSQCILTFNL